MGSTERVGDWLFRAREHSTTVSPDRQTVYAFDREGRPFLWYDRGRTYKRSLASDVFRRERVGGRRRHSTLSAGESARQFERIAERLSQAPFGRLDRTVARRLEGILRWTPRELLAESGRFDAAYRRVGILPPSEYLAVVLQATFGCSWNRCSFCGFYQDEPFRTRPVEEFRTHAQRVQALLGRGEKLRRRIFLGSGNALVLDNRRLLPIVRLARDAFPGRPWSGFVDVFGGERKSLDDWRELREAGLERVHVGVETGDGRLSAWLNKPGSREQALGLVSLLERAGLRVSVILLVGGRRFAADHVRNSTSLIERLPLDRGDVVYLSPFVEHLDSEYARRAAGEGVRPLDERQCEDQYAALREATRRSHPAVKVARYDLREFVY